MKDKKRGKQETNDSEHQSIGTMPSIVWVKVHNARALPVMDRASRLADAYVEVRFQRQEKKTKVCRKTLSPVWDAAFEFRVTDDATLLSGASFAPPSAAWSCSH